MFVERNDTLKCSSNQTTLLVFVRKDMNVDEHERIFNITLRHKFK